MQLKDDQRNAVQQIRKFTFGDESYFILSGSAGKGKTSIIQSIRNELNALKICVPMCAPTERESRILQQKARHETVTIHSSIYTLDNLDVLKATAYTNDSLLRDYFPLRIDQLPQAI